MESTAQEEQVSDGDAQAAARRRQVLKRMGAIGGVSLAGCLGPLQDESTPTIKMGSLVDQTSEATRKVVGELVDAIALPLEQLSQSALSVTVDHQIADTENKAEQAVSAATSLATEGYPTAVGPTNSAMMLAVAEDVLIPEQIVTCSPSVTTPRLTEIADNGYIFRTIPSDAFQGAIQAIVATETLGAETAVTLYIDDPYGNALNDAFVNQFQPRGGKVLQQVPFEPGRDSYSDVLATALSNDPDVLVLSTLSASGITMLQDYYANYGGHDIIVPDGMKYDTVMDGVDTQFDNIVGTRPLAEGPNHEAFAQRYRDAYDTEARHFTPNGYDAAAVVALATLAAAGGDGTIKDNMPRVASAGGQQVGPASFVEGARRVLDGDPVEYMGASGPIEFDSNGDIATAEYEVWQYDPPDEFTRQETITFSR